MGKIFYNKKTAVLFVALAVVIIFLLMILLTSLTQLSSLKLRAEEIGKLIDEAQNDSAKLEELLRKMDEDEYIIAWAKKNNLFTKDQEKWLSDNGK